MATTQLTPGPNGLRSLMCILFVLWGLLGFCGIILSFIGGSVLAGAMVGATVGVIWIGGMIFFGIAAMLVTPNFIMTDVRRTGVYQGYRFREMVDWSVQVDTADGLLTYSDYAAFKKAVRQ